LEGSANDAGDPSSRYLRAWMMPKPSAFHPLPSSANRNKKYSTRALPDESTCVESRARRSAAVGPFSVTVTKLVVLKSGKNRPRAGAARPDRNEVGKPRLLERPAERGTRRRRKGPWRLCGRRRSRCWAELYRELLRSEMVFARSARTALGRSGWEDGGVCASARRARP
jgi:hypothetical protein